MKGTAEAGLEVAQQGVDPAEQGRSLWCLQLEMPALSWQLALVTARKQSSPSRRTWLTGARLLLAQSTIASELGTRGCDLDLN